jgi:hypothetical protein
MKKKKAQCEWCDEWYSSEEMFDYDTCIYCQEEFDNKEALEEEEERDSLRYMNQGDLE